MKEEGGTKGRAQPAISADRPGARREVYKSGKDGLGQQGPKTKTGPHRLATAGLSAGPRPPRGSRPSRHPPAQYRTHSPVLAPEGPLA